MLALMHGAELVCWNLNERIRQHLQVPVQVFLWHCSTALRCTQQVLMISKELQRRC